MNLVGGGSILEVWNQESMGQRIHFGALGSRASGGVVGDARDLHRQAMRPRCQLYSNSIYWIAMQSVPRISVSEIWDGATIRDSRAHLALRQKIND